MFRIKVGTPDGVIYTDPQEGGQEEMQRASDFLASLGRDWTFISDGKYVVIKKDVVDKCIFFVEKYPESEEETEEQEESA